MKSLIGGIFIFVNEVFKLKLCLIFVNFVDVLQYQWLKQMENGKKECLRLMPTNNELYVQ